MKKILILIAIGLVILFVIFIINQTNQLVAFADRLHPTFGNFVFWTLIVIYSIIIGLPFYLIICLPKPLIPPPTNSGARYDRYLTSLALRLKKNPNIKINEIASLNDIKTALQQLDALSDVTIKTAAKRAFITTAISQNGALDTVAILILTARLVWDVARIYNQRPTVAELIWLYTNIAGTAFIAGQLEDAELIESATAGLTELAGGSLLGAIPGAGAAANILTHSLITGTANAWLILRVGCITKHYCSNIEIHSRKQIRHSAMLQASEMLARIVFEGGKMIKDKFWGVCKDKVVKGVRIPFLKRKTDNT